MLFIYNPELKQFTIQNGKYKRRLISKKDFIEECKVHGTKGILFAERICRLGEHRPYRWFSQEGKVFQNWGRWGCITPAPARK
jgi:hypothetical protein